MEHVTFSPRGVCAMKIDFDIEDGKLYNVQFLGGCNGNLKAIGKLVEGKDAREVAKILDNSLIIHPKTQSYPL